MTVYSGEWAIFNCIGPNPQTLQSVNTRIFSEWLPGNPDYELSGNATVEWYLQYHHEKKEDGLHMKMRIIFLFGSNPASQMPKSVFVLNCLINTDLIKRGAFYLRNASFLATVYYPGI